ncbi:SpaA isopeptide-forming pilin-related protein [Lactiplantibacillus plajomi]|uniref:SpaA isopeptide-forming pilin-related protein n=1 Tax=Lactiplantibacillus plajomi TaxID=1457217 RepID=A0ABV6K0I7_9LACO|nr:SpaA isopeptide-forming pilin-related protein [Lactiplantibacillus plajomi]
MRRKLFASLLSLLTVLTMGLLLTSVAKADEIPTLGLTSGDAAVTDQNGNVVNDTTTMSKWESYTVKYNWSIRDGQPIAAGDTATVQLPTGAVAPNDLSIGLKDNNGQVVGTFTIKAGQSAGTITFNDVLSQTGTNRIGTLQFYAKGTSDTEVHFNWTINKIGWIGSYDANGLPDRLTWNVAFNPTGQALGTVVVTDTLGPNQTFIPGTISAQTGHYDEAGNFVGSGSITPTVQVSGSQITFTFSNVTTAVNMTYGAKLANVTEGANNWSNTAAMNGDSVSGNVSYGGDGTGNGDNQLGSVTLTKTDAESGAKLSGAEYKLVDATGTVIRTSLTTDEYGQLSVNGLQAGDYQLVETKAPEGYQLDTTPVPFTIDAQNITTPVLVSQTNHKLAPVTTGSVVLSKTDAKTGEALAGATFDLQDANGNVLMSDLTTDANGKITLNDLQAGDYQFVEVKAPTDYQLNKTPIKFTITAGQTAPIVVSATNQPIEADETPGEPTPGEPTPGEPTPGEPTPGEPTPGEPTPGEPTPGEPTPGEPTPGEPTPGEPTPGEPTPGEPTPGEPTPGEPTPGEPTPGEPTPGEPTPGEPTPGANGDTSTSQPGTGSTGTPTTGSTAGQSPATTGSQSGADTAATAGSATGTTGGTNRPQGAPSTGTTLPQTNELEDRPELVTIGLAVLVVLFGIGLIDYRRRQD